MYITLCTNKLCDPKVKFEINEWPGALPSPKYKTGQTITQFDLAQIINIFLPKSVLDLPFSSTFCHPCTCSFNSVHLSVGDAVKVVGDNQRRLNNAN